MNRINWIPRRTLLGLAAFVGLVVLLMVLSRLTTPSADQREAISLMQRDDLPDGPNAFGLLWTLDRDVPFDEIDVVVQSDVAQVADWPDNWGPGEAPGEEQKWQRDTYPDLSPPREDYNRFCRTGGDPTCLSKVRAAPEATAEAVERNARLLARIRQFRNAEMLRNVMPPKLLTPMPSFSAGHLPMTAHALAFIQGNEEDAVAETCRDLAAWRRLALNTDMLIGTMVGIAYAGRGYGQLLAEMLAEWPVDQVLPKVCDAALAPPREENLRLCHAVRGEFRLQEATSDLNAVDWEENSWLETLVLNLFYDRDSTVALAAEQLAPYCTTDSAGRLDHDWRDTNSDIFLRWTCVGNPLGCALTGAVGGVDYGDYADRMLDFDARLRQLWTLAWMREQAESGARADTLIERLPPELRNEDQPIKLTPDGRSLRVALLDDRHGQWAEIPLPPALWSLAAKEADY